MIKTERHRGGNELSKVTVVVMEPFFKGRAMGSSPMLGVTLKRKIKKKKNWVLGVIATWRGTIYSFLSAQFRISVS